MVESFTPEIGELAKPKDFVCGRIGVQRSTCLSDIFGGGWSSLRDNFVVRPQDKVGRGRYPNRANTWTMSHWVEGV